MKERPTMETKLARVVFDGSSMDGKCTLYCGKFPVAYGERTKMEQMATQINSGADSWAASLVAGAVKPLVDLIKMWLFVEQWGMKHHNYCDSYSFANNEERTLKPCNCGIDKMRAMCEEVVKKYPDLRARSEGGKP